MYGDPSMRPCRDETAISQMMFTPLGASDIEKKLPLLLSVVRLQSLVNQVENANQASRQCGQKPINNLPIMARSNKFAL